MESTESTVEIVSKQHTILDKDPLYKYLEYSTKYFFTWTLLLFFFLFALCTFKAKLFSILNNYSFSFTFVKILKTLYLCNYRLLFFYHLD